jgi:predicted transcriptional regulator
MSESYSLYPLQVFRVVAQTGSVTRAANELFISQPAVSAHLKAHSEGGNINNCGARSFRTSQSSFRSL